MKVRELKEILDKYPDDTEVMVEDQSQVIEAFICYSKKEDILVVNGYEADPEDIECCLLNMRMFM